MEGVCGSTLTLPRGNGLCYHLYKRSPSFPLSNGLVDRQPPQHSLSSNTFLFELLVAPTFLSRYCVIYFLVIKLALSRDHISLSSSQLESNITRG